MRMSIEAQSWASVPPAPALISSCASRKSSGPESNDLSRSDSISSASLAISPSRSDSSSPSDSRTSISSSSNALCTPPLMVSKGSIQPLTAFTCWTIPWACCCLSQKPGADIRSSSRLSVSRLASRSKVPPQLGQPVGELLELLGPIGFSHCRSVLHVRNEPSRTARTARRGDLSSGAKDSAARLENLLARREDVVQRVLKVRGRFREILSDLIDEFLVTLLDLLAKDLFQSAIAQPVVPLLRKVRHQIGHERARQTPRLGVWIVRQKRIDGHARGRAGRHTRTR